jgi:hypothetical protein
MAIAVAAGVGPALAQSKDAQLYAFHSGKTIGGCPGIDWHITVEPDKTLIGFVTWDQMTHMAKVQGKIAPDGTFAMDAKEVGSNRTAKVTGKAAGQYINAVVTGTGTACDNQNIPIPRVAVQ